MIRISKETKNTARSLVNSGVKIPDELLAFVAADIGFIEELYSSAIDRRNEGFIFQVHLLAGYVYVPESIKNQVPKKRRIKISDVLSQTKPKPKSKFVFNKHIDKISFSPEKEALLQEQYKRLKGLRKLIDANARKTIWVTFVRGGLPSLGKRR